MCNYIANAIGNNLYVSCDTQIYSLHFVLCIRLKTYVSCEH